MKWDPKNPVAPFGPDGSLQHYPEAVWRAGERSQPQWLPVAQWSGTLKLADYARGRSAAYFILEDRKTGHRYPMMLRDFFDLVASRPSATAGEFSGHWTVCKRGQHYGIKAI